VPVGLLLLTLVAGQGDLLGVDDDDEVTGVDVRGEGRLVLAAQQRGRLRRETPEDDVTRVDDVPATNDVAGLGGVRAHGRNLRPRQEASRRHDPPMSRGGLRRDQAQRFYRGVNLFATTT
jgi:hypothetical protein